MNDEMVSALIKATTLTNYCSEKELNNFEDFENGNTTAHMQKVWRVNKTEIPLKYFQMPIILKNQDSLPTFFQKSGQKAFLLGLYGENWMCFENFFINGMYTAKSYYFYFILGKYFAVYLVIET